MTLCRALLLAGCLLFVSGCDRADVPPRVDLNRLALEEIAAKAKEEGRLNTVGMPDTWANWPQTWEDLERLYGLRHRDLDMSSGEEVALLLAEKDAPSKDMGDVGLEYAARAKAAGATLPYRTSYWDEIPAWAKDDRGDWIAWYSGTIVFLVNDRLVDQVPETWRELLEGDYKVSLGDMVASAQSQAGFYASAVALGGSARDLRPGIEFWKEMARRGRIETGDNHPAPIADNRIPVAILWDFNALHYRELALRQHPDASFSIRVPRDGTIRTAYASIINALAPHPHAAALAREYILSDAGQLNLARGYAMPIRDVRLPVAIRARMVPASQYEAARIVTGSHPGLLPRIADIWTREILPLMPEP